MRKKLLDFMQGGFGIFVCIAILFPLLAAVTPSSQYLYAENSTATVKALVIAGGGAGAVSTSTGRTGGGGGAGGYIYNAAFEVTAQEYPVTVGQGATYQDNGENSVFSSITATGGGLGGEQQYGERNGKSGGSGGGGCGSDDSSYVGTGGAASPAGQGSAGGNGSFGGQGYGAGGGGGAGGVGQNGSSSKGGDGGIGIPNSISGLSVYYAGGGGGWSSPNMGSGGLGGGGNAGTPGTAGTPNTGGGGGGGTAVGVGSGGSGIVIIRYVTADFGECTGGTITTDGADTIHTFTESGTFTVVLRTTPTVTTGTATSVTSSSATLNGTVNANGLSTAAWFNYGTVSGSYTGTTTTQTVSGSSNTSVSAAISGLTASTTYYYRIAASNSGGTVYGSEASFTTGSAPTPTPTPTDTTAPSGSVSMNSGDSYTNSTSVTLTLSATDSVGVVGYYASTSLSTPVASASGWNSVTSTTSYTGSVSYSLASGDEQKTVYVWYKDAVGNVSSATSDSITLDTTAPIVTITSPASNDTYTTTSSPLDFSGSASDTTSGVKEVTWSNDKGGSGTSSGTTYWSVSSISLTSGDNKITVTAKDNAGNTSTDTITVTYNAGSAPTVTTESATDVTTTTATLNGTVNANGISTTAWFEYGTLSGTYGNKTTTKSVSGSTDTKVSIVVSGLTSGTTYYYRIVAQNSAGTSYGKEMSFYYSTETKAPTVATEAATNVTDTSATVNGKCNPNGLSTTAWFEYGTLSGTYEYKTSTQSMSGSSYTKVSAAITGLTAGTTYYYRIVAKNSVGTSYGTEMEFYKSPGTGTTPTPTATPTPVTSPAPTLPPLPTPQVSPSPSGEGIVFGFVNDEDEQALESVTVTIVGANGSSPYQASTETDENGYYEFSGLEVGNYTVTYQKDGYETQTQDISLEEGELKDLDTVTMEQSVSGKIHISCVKNRAIAS